MKARSDSLFAKLKPAQREELFTLLVEGGAALADGIALLKKWGAPAVVSEVERITTTRRTAARKCTPVRISERSVLATMNHGESATGCMNARLCTPR